MLGHLTIAKVFVELTDVLLGVIESRVVVLELWNKTVKREKDNK